METIKVTSQSLSHFCIELRATGDLKFPWRFVICKTEYIYMHAHVKTHLRYLIKSYSNLSVVELITTKSLKSFT